MITSNDLSTKQPYDPLPRSNVSSDSLMSMFFPLGGSILLNVIVIVPCIGGEDVALIIRDIVFPL